MTGAPIRASIITEKVAFVRQMIEAAHALPLAGYEEFIADVRNAAAAESYVRRALEGLFDIGRHILAKAFVVGPSEYKEIAASLIKHQVVSPEDGAILREMAGYRNRMVHCYSEITTEEMYEICTRDLPDIERITEAMLNWLRRNPEKVDRSL